MNSSFLKALSIRLSLSSTKGRMSSFFRTAIYSKNFIRKMSTKIWFLSKASVALLASNLSVNFYFWQAIVVKHTTTGAIALGCRAGPVTLGYSINSDKAANFLNIYFWTMFWRKRGKCISMGWKSPYFFPKRSI